MIHTVYETDLLLCLKCLREVSDLQPLVNAMQKLPVLCKAKIFAFCHPKISSFEIVKPPTQKI